jgi:hypothetical protein
MSSKHTPWHFVLSFPSTCQKQAPFFIINFVSNLTVKWICAHTRKIYFFIMACFMYRQRRLDLISEQTYLVVHLTDFMLCLHKYLTILSITKHAALDPFIIFSTIFCCSENHLFLLILVFLHLAKINNRKI